MKNIFAKDQRYTAPKGTVEVRIFEIPGTNLSWLHFFNEKQEEIKDSQKQLSPGYYDLVSFEDGVVIIKRRVIETHP